MREVPHAPRRRQSFSALQRAENSSIASRRSSIPGAALSFSALQRAENSSIPTPLSPRLAPRRFQCSSASRKFLNVDVPT